MAAIIANFTWTPEELRQARRAWLRYTEQGKIHRRDVWIAFLFGAAGLTAGVLLLVRDGIQFHQSILTLASSILLGFLFLVRMRSTQDALSRAQVRWSISTEQALIETGTKREEFEWSSIRRLICTPDGFLMWGGDGFEKWLPLSAFADAGTIQEFLQIVEPKVAKYERCT